MIICIVNGGDNVAVKNKYCLSVRAIKTQEKIYYGVQQNGLKMWKILRQKKFYETGKLWKCDKSCVLNNEGTLIFLSL